MDELTCVICGKPIDDPYGFNAAPVAEGRCCLTCDKTVVLPERLYQMSPAYRPKKK
jgi:hypothetical protein